MGEEIIDFFLEVYPSWGREKAKKMAYSEKSPRVLSTKVALDNEKVVGQANAVLLKESETIANLGYHVRPSYRLRGIGKKLCLDVINNAKRRGLDILFVEIKKNNLSSISLARSIGFEKANKEFIDCYREQLRCTKDMEYLVLVKKL